MSQKTLNIIFILLDDVNEKALVDVFSEDCDFTENEIYFREDTIKLGFKNEAERLSKEIYDKHSKEADKLKRLEGMIEDTLNINNFFGNDTYYSQVEVNVIEVEGKYIISGAYLFST